MKNKIILGIAGALLALASWFVGLVGPAPLGGSASEANQATTTDSTHASASVSYLACLGPCVLDKMVVVQPASAGWVKAYDATSTATTSYSSSKTATYGKQIAGILSGSDVVGDIELEVQAETGIVIETSTGFDGQYVITWKR